MQKKLTITISEEVYRGLYAKIGQGRISRFIDRLARPHVVDDELDKSYRAMSEDISREKSSEEWTDNLASDGLDETR
jgi:predicted CopG family antitoxin